MDRDNCKRICKRTTRHSTARGITSRDLVFELSTIRTEPRFGERLFFEECVRGWLTTIGQLGASHIASSKYPFLLPGPGLASGAASLERANGQRLAIRHLGSA